MKIAITITGTGYVGLSNAILLAQHNEVVAEWRKLTLSLVICQPPRKKKS